MLQLNDLLLASNKIFDKGVGICELFLPVIFLIRSIHLGLFARGSDGFWELFKGTILFFVLAIGFKEILKILVEIPEEVGALIAVDVNKKYEALSGSGQMIPMTIKWVFGWLLIVLFYIGKVVYAFLFLLISSIAPFVFLLSCVAGVGAGVSSILSFLILISVWPLTWIGIDGIYSLIRFQDNSFGDYFVLLLAEFSKLISPFFLSKFVSATGSGLVFNHAKNIVSAPVNSMTKIVAKDHREMAKFGEELKKDKERRAAYDFTGH